MYNTTKMKGIALYKHLLPSLLFLVCTLLLISCGGDDHTEVENNITSPKELEPPQGAVFDYLLSENDFEVIPADKEKAIAYVEENVKAGKYSYILTNKQQFGPGYVQTINNPQKGQWLKTVFDCYKPKGKVNPNNVKGFLVISYHRGDSTLYYKSFDIYKLLRAQNKQFIEKWETVTAWYEVPNDIQQGDQLRIYHWNPEGGHVYLDNFKIEAWTTNPYKAPSNYILSHGIIEQNYENPATPGHTKEVAARGVGSIILSKNHAVFGEGYNQPLKTANAEAGDFIRITFSAFKHHLLHHHHNSAAMVVSVKDEKHFYKAIPINPRIWKNGKQVIKEWIKLELWVQIPPNVSPEDQLKVYPYNNTERPIYIDDLLIEVWKPNQTN